MEKDKGKKSLLTRFKPCALVDAVLPAIMPKPNSSDPVLSYIAVANKHGAVLPATLMYMLRGAAVNCGRECGCVDRRNKKGRNRWRALRTAMNGTTLMRKVISRRKASKENLSPLSKSSTNLGETNNFTAINSPMTSPSSLTSSGIRFPALLDQVSMTSPSTHDIYSMLQTPLNNGTSAIKNKQCGVALSCMILICLLVLVLWGRLPAIMCTSVWLYIVHPRIRKLCNERSLFGESDVDNLVQNKNKIVERKFEKTRS